DQLTKELESTQAQLIEKKSLVYKTAGQIESVNLQLARLRADRIGLVDMVSEARGALLESFSRQRKRTAQLTEQQQQLSALALQKEYLAQLETQQQLAARATELAAAVEATAAERDTLAQLLAATDRTIATQRETVNVLTQESKSAAEALTNRQSALDALQVAAAQARSAAEQLSDPQLDATLAALDEKQLALNEQLAGDKQLATQKEAELVSATATLDKNVADRAALSAKQQPFLEQERQLAEANAGRDAAVADCELANERLRHSWERRFAVRALIPLAPEQLAGSTISALELAPRYQREAEAEWQANHKDKKPEEIEEAKKATEIAQLLKNRIDQVASTYVAMFAAPGGSPQDVFSATADQALFFANDGRVQAWFNPAEGSLLKRLEAIENPAELADELHLAILSRPATNDEKSEVEAYLAERQDDRNTAIREAAWGLLTSIEFRFNR
ncbi:MAG: hypothetical protein KDA57_14020, partial [Planctomycetales bacterium]|nr:hypothetical protein [Planctomycetales bacterium]